MQTTTLFSSYSSRGRTASVFVLEGASWEDVDLGSAVLVIEGLLPGKWNVLTWEHCQ